MTLENKNLIQYYANEMAKIQRDIEDLWEVGKKSRAKEKRLDEIDLIITGLTAEIEIKKLRQTIRDYKIRLEKEGINFDE